MLSGCRKETAGISCRRRGNPRGKGNPVRRVQEETSRDLDTHTNSGDRPLAQTNPAVPWRAALRRQDWPRVRFTFVDLPMLARVVTFFSVLSLGDKIQMKNLAFGPIFLCVLYGWSGLTIDVFSFPAP